MSTNMQSFLNMFSNQSIGVKKARKKRGRGRPSKVELLAKQNEIELPDGTISRVSRHEASDVLEQFRLGGNIPEDQLLLACNKLDIDWTPPLPYTGDKLCYKHGCKTRATLVLKNSKVTLHKHYCVDCYDMENE